MDEYYYEILKKIALSMFRERLLGIFHGSISAKIKENQFLINKKGAIFDSLGKDDFITLFSKKDYRRQDASIDSDIHINIYKNIKEAKFVTYALPLDTSCAKPYVILMTGINGAGKTTTIGKLARHFQQEGKKVMLAAGDTFRAAAVEQLQTWGARHNVPVIAQGTGADAASVAYDALQSATARGIDVLIIDTAGRLHTQDHLMEELKKIKRVIAKLDPAAPHETMLIIDAGNGQNALRQAEQFHKAMQLDSITVTKLDGTAKGGILFAISEKLGIPIRYIGVGEQPEDLRPFNAQEFVQALLYAE